MYTDKEALREYQRNWLKRRRKAWLKEHGPCIDCGSWEDLRIFQPSGRAVDSRVWSWSDERRNAALQDAVIRCRSCRVTLRAPEEKPASWETVTLDDVLPGHTHGGAPSRAHYQRHNCRHPDCVAANTAYQKKYRVKES